MKSVHWLKTYCLLAIIILLSVITPHNVHATGHAIEIQDWQVMWIPDHVETNTVPKKDSKEWLNTNVDNPLTVIPSGMKGMWVHFTIPPTTDWNRPGLLVNRLYGHNISVFHGYKLLHQTNRDFAFDLNKILVPINQIPYETDYYIQILTTTDRAGLISGIQVDDFDKLSDRFVIKDLPDLLLGTSISFLALIMLVCSGYLHQKQRGPWISLCIIAMTTGALIIFYSPLPYIYFREYGDLLLLLFDISLFVLFPSLNYYIDKVFEGQFKWFTRFRYVHMAYFALCLIALIVYRASDERNYQLYHMVSNLILGVFILIQLIFIIILSVLTAFKGNKDAIILSFGIFLLALSGTTDLVFYYLSDKRYVLFLWKFGVVALIITLVIILARRISSDYGTLVSYSKELELYNHRLQRTEKLKIISDLAASVAHEVRNPLQVTRGFLQLLAGKSDEKDKPYYELATNELDRASEIITDFLTFAKPEMEAVTLLDLSEELKKLEAMMTPLAAMHGGVIRLDTQPKLYFHGNSSKLMQALINIIKNSIEALGTDGWIDITTVSDGEYAVVRIKDNGEGMHEDQIANLGVPFFSTKTKGTGLGLMVTFRIIEVMKGTIEFRSIITKGTEVTIRFPMVHQDESLPDCFGS